MWIVSLETLTGMIAGFLIAEWPTLGVSYGNYFELEEIPLA